MVVGMGMIPQFDRRPELAAQAGTSIGHVRLQDECR